MAGRRGTAARSGAAYPPLTPEQSALAAENVRLVYYLLGGKYRGAMGFYDSFEDAAQEGVLAVLRAARRYNPASGYAFNTYAGMAVINAWHAKRQQLQCCEKYIPPGGPPLRLDKHVGDLETGRTLSNLLPDGMSLEDAVLDRALVDRLRREADAMGMGRAWDMLERVVTQGESYSAVGADYGVCKERVRQLIGKVKKMLREHEDCGERFAVITITEGKKDKND